MGEPPRDGKKNDVQREDEIRRLQEMVSSLQVGVEELKKKPRKGSRKLKRRPSRGDEAKDDDEAAPTPAAAPAPPERALPAKTKYVSFTARGHGRVETEQSRGAAEEPESIEELTHRSLESIHDSKGREGKKGSFLLHKARKPKLDEKVNAEHAPFPKQPRRRVFPVQDPRTDARFGWDVWLMVLIFYVMLVTPFQISFTRAPDDFVDNFTAGDPPGYNKYIVLAVLNGVVDIMFFADLCLCFNTAFFEDNEWVVSRRRIAVNYVCSWFLLDLLSILPYQLISTRSGFLKMIRMVRLMKMLRVLKQPRIMARIAARNTMRAGQQAVCKYIAILLFLLHWTACAIRMIAAVTLDDCHKKRGGLENWRPDSDCAMTVLARFWNRGIWAQYVDALTWALGTLQGDFFTTNLAEQVLCLIVGLVGCIVMAFLIGDLCNVVGNMDPVGNDYTMTLDMLNSYLDEQNTPPALRMKLREYMGLAEKTFRDEQHKRILERLSPTLKAIVAHQNLGREVARIGFYEQAVRRTFRLYPGTRFAVYPKSKNRQDRPGPLRPCVITHVDDALLFSVRYDDDQSEEHDLVHSRVDVHSYELGFAFERDINRFIYEHDNFVLAVSHLLSTKFFMDRDFLIHQNMTPNEEMYVIQNGRCICWGEKRREKSINPILSFKLFSAKMTIGEDICMLTVGDKKPRPRLYTVRACATTEVYALSGVDFVALMDEGMFYAFPKHMRAYGCWQMIRYDLIRRSRELVDHRRIGAVSVLEIVPEAATVVPPESLREVAGRVLSKLGAAATAPRDAVAGRLATAGEETMRALHHLESVLDHPEHHTTATAVAVASGLEPIISPRRTVGGAPEPVGFGCAGDPSADFFAGAICGATSRGS
ncbi:voltage-gated potassium channel [Aureococcus anophagefferens]|uniref:Voltage-gated potassium channel n=2 Tax=Aureococcus anophagefferens TaxID=44056 RepID=A0ABR1FS99_AURAN